MKKLVMIMVLAISVSASNVCAQQTEVILSDKTGWHKIGETTIDFKKEKDVVIVTIADRFASLLFKVTEAPINLISLVIFYESGDAQRVKVNMPIKAPGQGKFIKLVGGERSIKKIEFVYKTLPNRKDLKSHIEIWGLKTNFDKK
jgi:hypothetical protein